MHFSKKVSLSMYFPDPEACEQRWYRYSFSNCQFESVMENILEECGCYPAWMLVHAGNAIKNYYADTRHAEAESCRGYEITCYKKILGRMSNYTTITSPEGEKMPCLPACNDQLMTVGFHLETKRYSMLTILTGDNYIFILSSSACVPRTRRLLHSPCKTSPPVQQRSGEPSDHGVVPKHMQGRPRHAGRP